MKSINKNIDQKILYLLIFTAPFTATSILNFKETSFSLPFVIGFLFLLIELKNIVLKKHKINFKKINLFLFIFIVHSFLSILFSSFINSDFKITFQSGVYERYYPDFITMFKHYIYLLYSFSIYTMIVIYFYNIKNSEKAYYNTILILKYTARAMFVLGVYQIIAYRFGLKFDEIFRMNPSSNIQPYGSFIRVSGPNIEPSMFSIYLVLVTSILLFDDIKKNSIDIVLLIISGILSTSSTFFVGLCLIGLVYFIFEKKRMKLLKISIVIIVIYILLILVYPQILLLTQGIAKKMLGSGVSGSERIFNMIEHLKIGLKYPLTGIGYGMARSKDLISSWTANIGILGIIIFILAIINSIKKINKKTKGFYVGLILIFILEFISVPEPYFLYIWVVWGIIDSGFLKLENKK